MQRSIFVLCSIALMSATGCLSSGESSAGASGESAVVIAEPAGANCAFGGVRVSVGSEAPTYVCNGADGSPGQAGDVGDVGDGGVAPIIDIERIGDDDTDHECANGGVKVTVDDHSGDAPAVEYLCDGVDGDGAPGTGASITVREFDAEEEDTDCEHGGLEFTITHPGEDDVVYSLCNGAEGTSGASSVSVADATDQCGDVGGIVVTVDGTDYAVCDGQAGEAGEAGAPGTSPAITVTPLAAGDETHECTDAGGYRVTIVSASGTDSFDLCHGGNADEGVEIIASWSFSSTEPFSPDVGLGGFWHSSMYDEDFEYVEDNDAFWGGLDDGNFVFGAENWNNPNYLVDTHFHVYVDNFGSTLTNLTFRSFSEPNGPDMFELCYFIGTITEYCPGAFYTLQPLDGWNVINVDLTELGAGMTFQGELDFRLYGYSVDAAEPAAAWMVSDVTFWGTIN